MLLSAILFYLVFLAVSYLIFKFIYKVILKSQKQISKFLVFLGSIALIVFYYTPYSYYLEPSYWEFRKICKLNELPNNAEKYNKILSYFDTDLESLDWEELNREAQISYLETIVAYRQKITNYSSSIPKNKGRLGYNYIFLYPNSKEKFSQQKLPLIGILATWHTKRFYPNGNISTSGLYWSEETLSCIDVAEVEYIMTPKEANSDK